MFRDRIEAPQVRDLPQPPQNSKQIPGKKCMLLTNCFSISMLPTGHIYHYSISIAPEATSLTEEEWIMNQLWTAFCKAFNGVFVVRSPGHIFSPYVISEEHRLFNSMHAEENVEKGYEAH